MTFSEESICRAVIATLMHKNVRSIVCSGHSGNEYSLEYIREEDRTLWKNACKIEGNSVIWSYCGSTTEPDFKGRWRTDPQDEKVTYKIETESLSLIIYVQYPDGSVTEKKFVSSDFIS